jgi:hypothetical protein
MEVESKPPEPPEEVSQQEMPLKDPKDRKNN